MHKIFVLLAFSFISLVVVQLGRGHDNLCCDGDPIRPGDAGQYGHFPGRNCDGSAQRHGHCQCPDRLPAHHLKGDMKAKIKAPPDMAGIKLT